MENRTPFFLSWLLRKSPQNSDQFGEQKGWENTSDYDTKFGGWGSSPGSTSSAPITNGWADIEPPANPYNGWGSSLNGKSAIPETSSNGWMMDQLHESEPISMQSRLVNAESFPYPPVPSAPPLPEKGFNEHHAASNNIDASCVVCWQAPVEGACVPCGHMATCMPCLRAIESKQGTCPVCRAKIDKVLRIYALSTE